MILRVVDATPSGSILTIIFPVGNVRHAAQRRYLGDVQPVTQVQEPAAREFLRHIFNVLKYFVIIRMINTGDHQSRSNVQSYADTPQISLWGHTGDG